MTNLYITKETFDFSNYYGDKTGYVSQEKRRNLVLSDYFYVDHGHGEEEPSIIKGEKQVYVVFGTPFIDGAPLSSYVGTASKYFETIKGRLSEIDSVFTIVEHTYETRTTRIYTDRYGCINIFVAPVNNTLMLSTRIRNIVDALRLAKTVELDKQAVFEFLWFRRLFGNKTFIEEIQTLESASYYVFKGQQCLQKGVYWSPGEATHDTSVNTIDGAARLIAHEIRKGVNLAIDDTSVNGLFLSGGLDSRALLGVGGSRYNAITNTPAINNEYEVARQLAESVNAKHIHLLRPRDYLDNIFHEATIASNGFTQYYECQFLGYVKKLVQMVDNVHFGLFLDVFYCGHYLPKHRQSIGRGKSLYFVLDNIDYAKLPEYFMANVSYRQKSTELEMVCHPATYRECYQRLLGEIRQGFDMGSREGLSGLALWEYMHLTNLGRHYSMLMASSLRPYMKVFVPILTTSAYDLAFTLPIKFKTNWSAYLKALQIITPSLMNIENANTFLKAKYSLHSQTLLKILKGVSNKALPVNFRMSPNPEDRSWPLVLESIQDGKSICEHVESTLQEGSILSLDLINRSKVWELYRKTREGEEDHSVFLNQLLTIEYGLLRFL